MGAEQLGLGVAGGVEVRHEGLVDHAEPLPDRVGVVQLSHDSDVVAEL